MKRGFFKVSTELYDSLLWLEVKPILDTVFTLQTIEQYDPRHFELHGTSELFDDCLEGATNEYEVFVHGTHGGKSIEIRKITNEKA